VTVVDIQLSAANADWPQLRSAALAAEERGFGAVWVYDHLGGVALGGTTMLECFALLGALAEVTTDIELGTLVANVWNREVGTLVTSAASIATMSGRPFHFGIGAGTSPTAGWAAEQVAVAARIEPEIAARHARVEEVLALTAAQWRPDRDESFATFPYPTPTPTRIVGVNSVGLSRVAGRAADGINVAWRHPRRDEFLAAADAEAGGRPFLRTAYTVYDDDLLDPDHPDRTEMKERRIDRLILAVLGPPQVGEGPRATQRRAIR
jgi:alkanesulfonate monooxygenase SsuD/methylene tetrahydromethanopterin reductase-like flavin-dependent oxidoreductase (luciferase family)